MNPSHQRQIRPRQNGCGCGRRKANIMSAQKKPTTEQIKKSRTKMFS